MDYMKNILSDNNYEFNITVRGDCNKYKTSPFSDYIYDCKRFCGKGCYSPVKIVTILITEPVAINSDLILKFNYSQINRFTYDDLSKFSRFHCECLSTKKDPMYFYQIIYWAGFIILIIIMTLIAIGSFGRRKSSNEHIPINNYANANYSNANYSTYE